MIATLVLIDEKIIPKIPFHLSRLEKTKEMHIGTLKAINQALVEFCKEVGVSGAQIIQWMVPQEIQVKFNEYLFCDEIDVDEGFALYVKDKFLKHWEHMV